MDDLTLRPATMSEVAAILTFWQGAAENDGRPADTAGSVEALITRDPQALIVAIDGGETSDRGESGAGGESGGGGEIVGTVIAGWDGWRCHLYRLAVAPRRRRAGVGRRLIAAAEERFRQLGGSRADAMVLDANEPAHGVWAAHDYAPQGDWSRWVKPLG